MGFDGIGLDRMLWGGRARTKGGFERLRGCETGMGRRRAGERQEATSCRGEGAKGNPEAVETDHNSQCQQLCQKGNVCSVLHPSEPSDQGSFVADFRILWRWRGTGLPHEVADLMSRSTCLSWCARARRCQGLTHLSHANVRRHLA